MFDCLFLPCLFIWSAVCLHVVLLFVWCSPLCIFHYTHGQLLSLSGTLGPEEPSTLNLHGAFVFDMLTLLFRPQLTRSVLHSGEKKMKPLEAILICDPEAFWGLRFGVNQSPCCVGLVDEPD